MSEAEHPSMESARPAIPGDLDRLVELAELGYAELLPTRGGAIWTQREARERPHDVTLAEAIERDDHHVVVGCFEGYTAGYGVVRIEPLQDGTDLAVVDDLFVEPSFRAVAIGEAMMNLAVDWATERGCVGIDAVALPGNRDTKNFFETFGLVARAIVVHRSLT